MKRIVAFSTGSPNFMSKSMVNFGKRSVFLFGGLHMFTNIGTGFGVQALMYLLTNLFFIVVTWWALQAFLFDVFLKDPSGPRAKIFMLLVTIAVGSIVGTFFFQYVIWSLRLRYLL